MRGIFAGPIWICLAWSSLAGGASPLGTKDAWNRANDAYKAGRYEQAAQAYEEVAAASPGGWVFYNLGNAYFKAGHLGRAVLCYKRADRLLPRSIEVRENLNMALDLTGVSQESAASVSSAFRTALSRLSLQEWLMLFSGSYGTGVFAGLLWVLWGRPGCRPLSLACLGLAGLILCLLGARMGLSLGRAESVVMVQECFGRVAPDEGEEKAFKVGEGAVLFLMGRERGNWVETKLPDSGARGWVPRDSIVMVDP